MSYQDRTRYDKICRVVDWVTVDGAGARQGTRLLIIRDTSNGSGFNFLRRWRLCRLPNGSFLIQRYNGSMLSQTWTMSHYRGFRSGVHRGIEFSDPHTGTKVFILCRTPSQAWQLVLDFENCMEQSQGSDLWTNNISTAAQLGVTFSDSEKNEVDLLEAQKFLSEDQESWAAAVKCNAPIISPYIVNL